MHLSNCCGEPLENCQNAEDLLFFEVDQVFVIFENPDVSEGAPGILDFLSGHSLARFLHNFFLFFLVGPPCPLDLDCCNMVHGKSMVLEKPPGE